MKIAILGSTGLLGKVLLEKALDAGYQVRTLVRSPDKLGEFKDRVEFIQGNVFEANDIEETVLGMEAVLSTVGPPQRNPGDPAEYEQAMKDLVAALEKQNIKRLIHVGGLGKVSADEKNLSRTNVNVEDLADFMLAQIDSKDWIRKAPLVATPR